MSLSGVRTLRCQPLCQCPDEAGTRSKLGLRPDLTIALLGRHLAIFRVWYLN